MYAKASNFYYKKINDLEFKESYYEKVKKGFFSRSELDNKSRSMTCEELRKA